MDLRKPTLGLLVRGYSVPGINSATTACVIEAINNGFSVIGFLSGFKYLRVRNSKKFIRLKIKDVTPTHVSGGSILKTSEDYLDTPEAVSNALDVLRHHRIKFLVAIGGPNTVKDLLNLSDLASKQDYSLNTVLIPKSIFDDFPLPYPLQTFGFSTARDFAARLVSQYYSDAKSTDSWYFINIMGSRAGHLCLSIGRGSASTLTLIPEEFKMDVTLRQLVDMVESCILKRQAMGRNFGVVLLSEGIVDKMKASDVRFFFGTIDQGHSLLAKTLSSEIQKRRNSRNCGDIKITECSIGPEIRCTAPDTTDREIARNLGFGAVEMLKRSQRNNIVAQTGENLNYFPMEGVYQNCEYETKVLKFNTLLLNDCNKITQNENDKDHKDHFTKTSCARLLSTLTIEEFEKTQNKNIKWKLVDTNGLNYQVARKYMLRLNKEDLKNNLLISKMSKEGNFNSPAEVVDKFGHIVN